jgi:hypothetical protein
MTPEQRIEDIDQALAALRGAWPFIASELHTRITELTGQLVNENNEQTRGRIKALLDLMELPITLQQERDGISAGLSDLDPA